MPLPRLWRIEKNNLRIMKKGLYFAALAACAVLLAGCDDGLDISDSLGEVTTPGDTSSQVAGTDSSGNLLDFDISWDDIDASSFSEGTETIVTNSSNEEYEDFVENFSPTSTVKIAYSSSSAKVTGSVSGVSVSTDGGYVTITSTATGVEYILSGTTTAGGFKLYSDSKFKLTLSGVSITSKKGAAINIQSSKRGYVVLSSSNSLTDASSYSTTSGEDEKGCFFSEGQLIFSGSGSLTVDGNYKHAICSDDYVRTRPGCTITATAEKDGIHANDEVIVGGGILLLTVGDDGINCEEGDIDIRGGLIKVETDGDAAKALKAETDISIDGASLILLTTGDAQYDSDDKDISSPAGIKCVNLSISDSVIEAKSTGKAGKGMNADGTLTITDSDIKVITTGTTYTYSSSIDSSAKGIKSDGAMTISGSTVWVRTSGGDGSEGIESKSTMVINGDEVCVYAYDDCINTTTSLTINGGNVYCYSAGNDGLDSNGKLYINGGFIVASGTTSPEEGIDCDTNTFAITGGTLLGIGGGTSTPTTNSCTQRSIIYGGSGNSDTLLSITDSSGSHIMSYSIPRTYSSMTLLFSCAGFTSGGSYTIYTGGSVSGGTSFYGLTTGGSFSGGTSSTTFTTSSMVTTVGNMSSGGPGTGGNIGGGWHW